MTDRKHSEIVDGVNAPAHSAVAVVPSDSSDLAFLTRAVYVGSGGDLQVTMADGAVALFKSVSAGVLPIRCSRVHATNTTAGDLLALC